MQASRFEARGVLDRPVGAMVDDRSRQVVAWEDGPARTPLTLLFVAYTTLALVLTGVGVTLVHASFLNGVRDWDLSVSEWLVAQRTPAWDDAMTAVSRAADTVAILGLALLACAVLALLHRWRDLLLIGACLGLEASVFITANALVRRPRPPVDTVGTAPGTFSFPSGHTAATIVVWGCLALLLAPKVRSRVLRAAVWLVPVVFATAVGYARVYRGMHFLTDVLMGAVLGVVALYVGAVAARASSLADHPEMAS